MTFIPNSLKVCATMLTSFTKPLAYWPAFRRLSTCALDSCAHPRGVSSTLLRYIARACKVLTFQPCRRTGATTLLGLSLVLSNGCLDSYFRDSCVPAMQSEAFGSVQRRWLPLVHTSCMRVSVLPSTSAWEKWIPIRPFANATWEPHIA